VFPKTVTAGRPDEFERIFGFPLYKVESDGTVVFNFEYVAIDIYNGSGNVGKDSNSKSRRKILEDYLGDRGVSVNITNSQYTAKGDLDSLEEALKAGQVILRQRPTILYNMDGTLYHDTVGGHAITVTGVTEDGNLIVSSWGGQYLVKPSDYSWIHPDFDLRDTDTWSTYLDYEVVTYE